MARTAVLAIKIVADATKAAKALDQTAGSTSKFERGLGKATKAAKVTLAGIGLLGGAAIKEASNLQQAAGAVDSVFGKSAPKIHQLATDAAGAVGLAQSEYSSLASVLGAQLKNLGVDQGKLVGTTDDLIGKGADLAATFGGTTADAVGALTAAFRGETDPIEKYGISLKQSDVNAVLAAKGQGKLTGKARKAAEMQARLALINEQSADATGQFARESDTAAGAQQSATAHLKNALANLGKVALPVVAQLAEWLGKVAKYVSDNGTAFGILIGIIGGLAGAVMAVNAAYKVYTAAVLLAKAATKAWTAVMKVFNSVTKANVISLIILAIIALIAIIIACYKRFPWFRAIVDKVMKACKTAVGWLIDAIKKVWQWVKDKLGNAFRWIKGVAEGVWRGISNAAKWVVNAVKSIYEWVRDRLGNAFRNWRDLAVRVFQVVRDAITKVIDKIRDVISWVRERLGNAFTSARDVIVRAMEKVRKPFDVVIGLIKDIIERVRNIKFPSPPGWVSKLGSLFTVPGRPEAGAVAYGRGRSSGPLLRAAGAAGAGRGGITINVSGALDPDAVARQIESLLLGQSRRRAGVVQRLRTQ